MQDIIPLSDLPLEQNSKIETVLVNSHIKQRLLDLGFIQGTDICCVLKNPANDLFAYLVRGTVIALRKEDSSKIFVTV